ncbi:MAG: hypothetical protein HZA47_11955 [Planctomycetes bacterium]|uniref:hypothetical protein n=1 Tax=Candidatus Wunengus sp. YC65 TaxID=3367701 RepID=UPI001D31FADB|nr:hypothetical protein [Planctomycetota bacterium]
MPKIAVHFIGFLVNVDDSVLGLKLGDGFDIVKQSQQQIMKILSRIEFHYGVNGTMKGVLGFDTDGRPSGYYCIVKYNAEELEGTAQGGVVIRVDRLKGIEQSIRNKIRLLRLFKEGNVFLRFSCFYYMKDSEPAVFQIVREGPLADTTRFELVESEIANAQSFLANNKIPFGSPQVQLAFESFELSYESHNLGLAFLSLMISLETLLNLNNQELSYRVSRNTAVLLGKNCENSKNIFAEVKSLYGKRSKLVHTGKHETITHQDMLCLRNYVRDVIKEMTKIGGDRNFILNTLNTCGFGERPWRK